GDVRKWTRSARQRARHMADGAGEAWDEAKHRAGLAAVDIKDGFGAAAQDLRGAKAPVADDARV
ncbi:MAG TPA: hypothetical protein VK188_04430, partial [Holophaga sp.]|nr:hypothetical protein [Holophaga sp.]